jgi:predicted transcriptional regulator of viral defense system
MTLNDAIEAALLDARLPAISDYAFFLLGARLHRERAWKGTPLSRLPAHWDRMRMLGAQRRLLDRRAIVADADFRSGVWRISQAAESASAEEIACIADPFCYVSHLSAMERYGLTDRSPEALHLTTPARPLWNAMRDARIIADLGMRRSSERRVLVRPGFSPMIRRRRVTIHETSHPADPVAIAGERTRITSIGQTFADMLDIPALCGGMRHVVDVWERSAGDWTGEIIAAVDALDIKIVKVRAGYLLSERLGIEDRRIDTWSALAQRGGSRKLDPDNDYAPTFSARWMISLNV